VSGSDEAGQVGIFWAMPDGAGMRLVTDATSLEAAEPYGDFLTHPNGHCETWAGWRAGGPVLLGRLGLPAAIAWNEYEDFPRGRVVFHVPDRCFTVYADRSLHGPSMRRRIVSGFALPAGRTRLLADPHYRTGRLAALQGEAP
jgi:hypothetical protein